MTDTATPQRTYWVVPVLLIAMAIGLQTLLTFKLGGTPIRIAASDLLVPVVLAMAALSTLRGGGPARASWHVPYLLPGLAVLTGLMAVSLVHGRLAEGEWITWALVNKGAGWLVLLAYFVAGSQLRTPGPPNPVRILLPALFAFGALASIVSIVLFVSYKSGISLHWGEIQNYDRPRGFAENTNAFAILSATLLALVICDAQHVGSLRRNWYVAVGALLLTALLLTGSRSGTLALIAGVLGIVAFGRFPWRRAAAITVVGLLLFGSVLAAAEIGNELYPQHDGGGGASAYTLHAPMLKSGSTVDRRSNIRDALQQWGENPILGIGLGRFLTTGRNGQLAQPATLHNTAVWILTETGLVGFVLFSGFFLYVAVSLYQQRRRESAVADAAIAFALLFAFAGASIGTEVMYQRYFWLLMGFFLTMPRLPFATGR